LDATLPPRPRHFQLLGEDGGVVKTILLVEDEQTLRTVVLFLLKSSGYNVIAADDGLDGLRKARECRGEIDALLADIVMPRMTGIELATQLSLDRPRVRVLLISGFATRTIVLQKGWQLLRKPFTLSLLKDKIRVLLQDESENGRCIGSHARKWRPMASEGYGKPAAFTRAHLQNTPGH
jgi:DNA-binding response OmpR family regulator